MTKQVKWTVILSLALVVVFCSSFVFFYRRTHEQARSAPPSLMGKPLPEANLVDSSDVRLEDSAFRKGRAILVFVAPDCPACQAESEFLKTVVGKRPDVNFYGVASFGSRGSRAQSVEQEYPFKIVYDGEPRLAGALGLYRVPIKVYLEDGIIKKSWKGATVDEQAKAEFVNWLDSL